MTETNGYGPIAKSACVGAGVIGAGWVARFLLAGIDVAVFDPHPDARRMVGEVLDNARWAYERLTAVPLPPRGELTFCDSIAEAVADADWIQESVPERIELKRSILTEIDAACRLDALIGSSTSGLLPSNLQSGLTQPQRFFVAHPYNPVYLLPLAEIVGGRLTSRRTIDAAVALLAATGMKGVPIDKEIDAFVGDRLLEALWREALWLIADDICTVETLDDVIRYSFGLRWAQMGLFQTYRIAGGEAGMRHFLAQFGPALQWPWTKLTDVVDLDDALIEKIAVQSNAQNEGLSIRRLERIRDENLIGILRALKEGNDGRGWGAGKLLAEFEKRLNAAADRRKEGNRLEPQLIRVDPAWVDYNSHMTEHRYLQVFGEATDAVLRRIGVDMDYVASGSSYYTVETHLRHLNEALLGDALSVRSTILSYDEKRLHLFHELEKSEDRTLVATGEHMLLHVNKAAGPASAAPPGTLARLEALTEAQKYTGLPEGAGRSIRPARAPKEPQHSD